nr:hypothetical protein JVH1_5087 [Rhodococcus sp. JVH1]
MCDTVVVDTPACRATSAMVGLDRFSVTQSGYQQRNLHQIDL